MVRDAIPAPLWGWKSPHLAYLGLKAGSYVPNLSRLPGTAVVSAKSSAEESICWLHPFSMQVLSLARCK